MLRSVIVFGIGTLFWGISYTSFALSGSNDSDSGVLDTIPPRIGAVMAKSESKIEVAFTKPMLQPSVTDELNYTVAGFGAGTLSTHPTTVEGLGPYLLNWTSGKMNSTIFVVHAVNVQDSLGNLIDPANDTAYGNGIGEKVPQYAWPLALVIMAAALLVLLRRDLRAYIPLIILLAALCTAPAALAQAPIVSNVTFLQSPNGTAGTKVDITYDLVAPAESCGITITLSKNGGADGFIWPVTSVTGDITGVTTGQGKHIVWDVSKDYGKELIKEARLRVTASDMPSFLVPEMVRVPSGSFIMGNSGIGDDIVPDSPELPGTYLTNHEKPAHSVTLSAYQIARYDVTNREYCAVLNWALAKGYLKTATGTPWTGTRDIYAGTNLQLLIWYTSSDCNIQYSNGSFSSKSRDGLPSPASYSMDAHPVLQVSWYGAVAYCNWLSEWQGLSPCYDMTVANWPLIIAPPNAGGYRLPTEAEWERTAAWDGSRHRIYGFTSDTLTGGEQHANYQGVNPLGIFSPAPGTSPVGWFNGTNISPNGNVATISSVSPIGCYDMCGNVCQWCNDWYSDNYNGAGTTDPAGPTAGSFKIFRGGSWFDGANIGCRTACRGGTEPIHTADQLGFRLAKS